MVPREYEFNYGEPGLFMEIYVAKKAEFQPLLYETLTAGFNLKKVRSHFRSKAEAIRRFMRRNRQLHDFSSYRIDHFGNVFTGYSLYEVDGTFAGGAQDRALRREDGAQESRLQGWQDHVQDLGERL